MFFGVSALQSAHVLVSFLAVGVGPWVLFGMFGSRRMNAATLVFLIASLITHRVRIASADEVDAEVADWIRQAWDKA